MIQDAPERGLEGLQLLCWSNFLIQSADKPILAINMIISYKTDLNFYGEVKTSLEIKEEFKFRDILLLLSSYASYPLIFSYKYPYIATEEGQISKQSATQYRAKSRVFLRLTCSICWYFIKGEKIRFSYFNWYLYFHSLALW